MWSCHRSRAQYIYSGVTFRGRKIKMSMEINPDRLAFTMTIAAPHFGIFAAAEAASPIPLKQLAFCQVEGSR
jgi:hypothetical protein